LWESSVKEELLQSDVIHADETGINVDGKNWWVHVLSTSKFTLMFPHIRRGKEGIKEGEVLPFYKGFVCHDFWSSYKDFDVIHVACNAHLLRELNKVTEKYKQKWSEKLSLLLIAANKERDANDGNLDYSRIIHIEEQYDKFIKEGLNENPQNTERLFKRGKIAQTYPRCLLERFVKNKSSILMFLYDPRVPFTNNQAERDIRMLKVQQKVSGCFRTEEGAKYHCRIRSYVLSMEKQGISAHKALEELFRET
jgi:transposase